MKPSPYWFPAKRYGWGWGMPSVWQGWAVLAVFGILLAGAAFAYPPRQALPMFLGCTLGLTVALMAVCVVKGEPPAWRWGK